ncbi:MAG: efflux RND transporter periplasmic adaptor subunit [Myxococcales bacterium]|nr:efflux RND transporter periplasmic adaptor subunit [Myxococcales bacterium]MCB9628243.1 efflux RND transporter periplasmic adaptor subunit [Sandaracinaceae bacterium]
MKRALIAALVLAVIAGGVYFFWFRAASDDDRPQETVRVRRGDLVEYAGATGVIRPNVQVEIRSRESGEVVEVLVEEGQLVEAGTPLIRLDPFDTDRAVDGSLAEQRRALAQLREARAALEVAEAEARQAGVTNEVSTRGQSLGLVSTESARSSEHQQTVAERQVEMRRAQVAAAQAALASSRLNVADAQRRREATVLVAPITGTVLSVNVERGSMVSSAVTNVGGGSAIMTLADLSDLRVIGAIDEAQIASVAVGQEVEIRVDAYRSTVFAGRVERVSPLGTNTSNVVTFDVEIVVTDERAAQLRSGMSANVEIVTNRQSGVLLIPLTAVQSFGDEHTILRADGSPHNIVTGGTDGTSVVVTSGLNEGDEISADPTRPREEPSGGGSGGRRGGGGPLMGRRR